MKRCAPIAAMLVCVPAMAQSLFLIQPEEAVRANETPGSQLFGVSIIAVPPPEPRAFGVHDLITIIIDENTLQEAEQSLETDKQVNEQSQINALVDLAQLLELRLDPSSVDNLTLLDFAADRQFEGEGEFERTDRFQGRIAAEVVDVKPNGTLVLEARSTIDKDGEVISILASGVCRAEDVTEQNTILSSQLANKLLVTRHDGDVEDTARKGLITRAIETLFAF